MGPVLTVHGKRDRETEQGERDSGEGKKAGHEKGERDGLASWPHYKTVGLSR